jgi:hypothetical protein
VRYFNGGEGRGGILMEYDYFFCKLKYDALSN